MRFRIANEVKRVRKAARRKDRGAGRRHERLLAHLEAHLALDDEEGFMAQLPRLSVAPGREDEPNVLA